MKKITILLIILSIVFLSACGYQIVKVESVESYNPVKKIKPTATMSAYYYKLIWYELGEKSNSFIDLINGIYESEDPEIIQSYFEMMNLIYEDSLKIEPTTVFTQAKNYMIKWMKLELEFFDLMFSGGGREIIEEKDELKKEYFNLFVEEMEKLEFYADL